MKRLLVLPVLLLTLLVGMPAFSADEKSSLEYAKLGHKLFSVIECSVYSEHIEDENERQRLHNLGISIGREFITAANDGKIEKKDWSNNVPTVFGLMRGGPSIDFVLGRWWEFILGHTFDKIEKKCGSDGCSSKDVKGVWAGNLYSDKNCKLIQ